MPEFLSPIAEALAGRYTIERELGAGGMSTVYLAQDLKHHRNVALKVLRPELSAALGAERFLTEIEVTAQLQHPNILPLYDSGNAEGLLYYVMPYVEGESLRDKLQREHQLNSEEVVAIAATVADALQYAHEKGILHRDIKPENILLSRGQPLVADFGIALAMSRARGVRLTETGYNPGTPNYMSPEQAAGDRELDPRSDVYSLGAVTYEMLVGEPPHVANSVQGTIARIIAATPPPINRFRELVPANVDAAVQRALARSPADRFPSAAKFADALRNPAYRLPVEPPRQGSRWQPDWRVVTLLGALVVTAGAALWGWLRPPRATDWGPGLRRLTVQLPDSAPLAVGTGRPGLAITPDGSRIVYVARIAGETQLLIKDLRTDSVIPIPGSTGATDPMISPSGGRVGFFVRWDLRAVPLAGGPTERISTVTPITRGAAWLSDTTAAVVVSPNSGVLRVPFALEAPDFLTPQRESRAWPAVLPGGTVLLSALPTGDDLASWRIAARRLSDGTEHVVVENGSNPRYVGGDIVFARQGGLWVVPFDPNRLQARGTPVLLQSGVLSEPDGIAQFAVSSNGMLVFAAGSVFQSVRRLVWVSPDGGLTPTPIPPGAYSEVALGPDGRRVALTRAAGNNDDVWVGDLVRGTVVPETTGPGEDDSPVWSPDGNTLALATEEFREPPKLALLDLGTGALRLAGDTGVAYSAPTGWSADGGTVFFRSSSVGLGRGRFGHDVGAYDVRHDTRSIWLQTDQDERAAVPSPDGRWVAYVSNETGQDEVYLRPRAGGEPTAVSVGGGVEPRWARQAGILYFRQGKRVMAVTLTTSRAASPRLSAPRVAFRLPSSLYLTGGDNTAAWDVAPDGTRVLALEETGHAPVTKLQVVLNWPAALRTPEPSR